MAKHRNGARFSRRQVEQGFERAYRARDLTQEL